MPVEIRRTDAAPALAAGLGTLVFALWLSLEVGGKTVTAAVSNTVLTIVPFVAGVSCLLASKRLEAPRSAWLFLAAGAFSWGLGQVVWDYHEIFSAADTIPYPGLYTLGYFGLLPLSVAGLLRVPARPTFATTRARIVLDGLVIGLSLFFISWLFVLEPLYGAGAGPRSGAAFVSLITPHADVVVATVALVVSARVEPEERAPLLMVAAGLLALSIADSAVVASRVTGVGSAAVSADTATLAGFLALAFASRWARHAGVPTAVEIGQTSYAAAMVPYIPLAAASGFAAGVLIAGGSLDRVLLGIILGLVLVVGARQLLSLVENIRLNRALTLTLEDLRKSEAFRTQLLNAISHDLANPLMPIGLQIHILKSRLKNLGEEERQSFDILGRNTELMTRLVNDLKDLAKMTAGQLKLDKASTSLTELAEAAAAGYRGVAQSRGVQLDGRIQPTPNVYVDEARINQVLLNLLSNAVKFTPTGGRVELECRTTSSDVYLHVRDSGRGLTPEEQARLFQPFSQVHDRSQYPEKGTGLGLYISRGIIERHDGRIWVESEGHGKGSTFAFTLPARIPEAQVPHPAPKS